MIAVIAICLRGCSISKRRPGRGRSPRADGKPNSGRQKRRSQQALNQPLTNLAIERLSHDGRGISRWQGKTLFVEGALEGELVEGRLLHEQSRYAEAVADKIILAAPERVTPPCAYYGHCGGCQFQHLAPEHQLQAKQVALLEQLQRTAGLAPKRLLAPIESVSQGYRSRARLGVWYPRRGGVTLGFRQRRSRELVDIGHCLVLNPVIDRLLQPLKEWLSNLQSRAAISHIELIAAQEKPAAILRQMKPLAGLDLIALGELGERAKAMLWLQDSSDGSLRTLTGELCDPRLSYRLPEFNLKLEFHPRDFTQVNERVNAAMVAQAMALLKPGPEDRVLDLFCGIGNFTLALARFAGQVVGVEAVESMVLRGRENARLQGLGNLEFIAADLTQLSGVELFKRVGKISALLLDPPREGAREILAGIGQLAPDRLVYVSCNPATLARDAGLLALQGYRLEAVGVLDMFPHTSHVESMALFQRA